MLYTRTDSRGRLVLDEHLVGPREHLSREHRIITLTGPITNETDSVMLLLAMDSISNDPIRVLITSGGGDLDAALLLYDVMRLVKAPIYTFGRYCASAAVMLLAVGTRRFLSPHAKVMLHLPSSQSYGDTKDQEIWYREMQKYKQKMIEVLIESGAVKTYEQILTDVDRDFWLEPQEAIDYGLADEIMTPDEMGRWLHEG